MPSPTCPKRGAKNEIEHTGCVEKTVTMILIEIFVIVGFKPKFPISSIKVTPLGYLTVIKTFLQSKLKK